MEEGETPHPRHAMEPCTKTVGITSKIYVVALGKFFTLLTDVNVYPV